MNNFTEMKMELDSIAADNWKLLLGIYEWVKNQQGSMFIDYSESDGLWNFQYHSLVEGESFKVKKVTNLYDLLQYVDKEILERGGYDI